MAQPKRKRNVSPQKQELENLEKKSSRYAERRNELNDQAKLAREERDLLNGKKKQLFSKMNALKAERDKFNEELRKHKEARDQLQAEAKALIAKKRGTKRKGKDVRSAPMRAREIEHEIREMSYTQETSVLEPKKEKALVDRIRDKKAELKALEPELEKAKSIKVDLSDTDAAIDELFSKADEEHEAVVANYKASQERHEQYVALVKEVGAAIAEANAKHEEYIKIRKRADEQHQKFVDMREKILELKGASRKERQEARKLIKQQAEEARKAVADPKKLKEHEDKSLEELKKGGKIRIG